MRHAVSLSPFGVNLFSSATSYGGGEILKLKIKIICDLTTHALQTQKWIWITEWMNKVNKVFAERQYSDKYNLETFVAKVFDSLSCCLFTILSIYPSMCACVCLQCICLLQDVVFLFVLWLFAVNVLLSIRWCCLLTFFSPPQNLMDGALYCNRVLNVYTASTNIVAPHQSWPRTIAMTHLLQSSQR